MQKKKKKKFVKIRYNQSREVCLRPESVESAALVREEPTPKLLLRTKSGDYCTLTQPHEINRVVEELGLPMAPLPETKGE